jgi:DNA-binding MarR family transcriptional regulator
MVRAQHRLGVNPTQFCILIQLLEHWRTRERAPFPTKQQLADRIGVSQSTIQQNMQQLEKAGLVKRVKAARRRVETPKGKRQALAKPAS